MSAAVLCARHEDYTLRRQGLAQLLHLLGLTQHKEAELVVPASNVISAPSITTLPASRKTLPFPGTVMLSCNPVTVRVKLPSSWTREGRGWRAGQAHTKPKPAGFVPYPPRFPPSTDTTAAVPCPRRSSGRVVEVPEVGAAVAAGLAFGGSRGSAPLTGGVRWPTRRDGGTAASSVLSASSRRHTPTPRQSRVCPAKAAPSPPSSPDASTNYPDLRVGLDTGGS